MDIEKSIEKCSDDRWSLPMLPVAPAVPAPFLIGIGSCFSFLKICVAGQHFSNTASYDIDHIVSSFAFILFVFDIAY